jgi:hypothetical protein
VLIQQYHLLLQQLSVAAVVVMWQALAHLRQVLQVVLAAAVVWLIVLAVLALLDKVITVLLVVMLFIQTQAVAAELALLVQ